LPVNQGRTRFRETAGILIGATVILTSAGSELVSPSAPSEGPSAAFRKVTLTGLQCFPDCASVETFDHTVALSSKLRLVASSNS
jgi:hypothetical protein